MSKRILDVGQCGFDGPRLRRMLGENLAAQIDTANTREEAVEKAAKTPYDLVLINRVLNQDHSPGLAVIDALRKAHPHLPLMLVSDRSDAQDEAEKHGAVRGFGKSQLYDEETESLLRAVLQQAR